MTHARKWAAAWLQAMAELLLAFPLLVLVPAALPDPPMPASLWLLSLSLVYAAGYAFYYAFPAIRHWQSLLAALAVPGLLAWLAGGPAPAIAANAAVWLFAWVRGRQNRLRGWDRSFPVGYGWIGMAVYFLASFFYPKFELTELYAPWITGFGIASLALMLYRTNSSTLEKESLSTDGARKPHIGSETKWRNRVLVLSLFAVLLVAASFGAIAAAVKQAGLYVLHGIADLIRRLLALFSSSERSEAPPPQQQPNLGEMLGGGEPSAFAKLMEKVLFWVVIVVLIAVALLLLYWIGKHAARWWKRFMGWYGERLESSSGEGYVDEKQTLLDGREWARERAEQWRRRLADLFRREPGWDDLPDNRERIRHAYRRLLLRRIAAGYEHDAARTPRETGRELERRAPLGQAEAEAIGLYEEARYGGKDVSDERAAAVRKLFADKK